MKSFYQVHALRKTDFSQDVSVVSRDDRKAGFSACVKYSRIGGWLVIVKSFNITIVRLVFVLWVDLIIYLCVLVKFM